MIPARAQSLCEPRRNRRICASSNPHLNPTYRAKNDTLEFNADYAVTPSLTLTSQTGYNKDFLYSTEDFNASTRFRHCSSTDPTGIQMSTGPMIGRHLLRSATGLFEQDGGRGSFAGTCLAILSGSAAGFEFQRAAQFQRRRQLSALSDGRRLLCLLQSAHSATRTDINGRWTAARRTYGLQSRMFHSIAASANVMQSCTGYHRLRISSASVFGIRLRLYRSQSARARSTVRATIISAARIPIACNS